MSARESLVAVLDKYIAQPDRRDEIADAIEAVEADVLKPDPNWPSDTNPKYAKARGLARAARIARDHAEARP